MASELLATARRAAQAGAEVLRRAFGASDLEVRTKGLNDFVTRADRESEEAIAEVILGRFPDHRLIGEEGGERGGGGEIHWYVDPLDGTTNFLHGLPIFAVSVGCLRGGEPIAGVVLDPLGGHLFEAERGAGAFRNGERLRVSQHAGLAGAFLATGYPFRAHAALAAYLEIFRDALTQTRAIRRCGAAALDLAYTAAGVYDGFFEFRLSPWDVAAGALLIEEAGGRISDLEGGRGHLARGNVLAGNPSVHRDLMELVARHADESLLDRLVPAAVG